MENTTIVRLDGLKSRTEQMEGMLNCLADVVTNGQPGMTASLYEALKLARRECRQITEGVDGLSHDIKAAEGDTPADKMSKYKTELEKAITGAGDLVCTVNAVGDAMDTGMSAAADYVGAVRVLAQAAETHARDLKAMRLCMAWEEKEQPAPTKQRNPLFDLDAEVNDAEVFVERVEFLLGGLCEDYFNRNPKTPEGKEDIVFFFKESRINAEMARSFALDLRKALSGIRAMITNAGEVKST